MIYNSFLYKYNENFLYFVYYDDLRYNYTDLILKNSERFEKINLDKNKYFSLTFNNKNTGNLYNISVILNIQKELFKDFSDEINLLAFEFYNKESGEGRSYAYFIKHIREYKEYYYLANSYFRKQKINKLKNGIYRNTNISI